MSEGNLYGFKHVVQRLQERDHAHGVMVGEVEPGCLLQSFVPQLVPEDSNPDELMTDEQSLLNDDWAVLFHAVHDVQGSLLPDGA